uniref:guanylate cyclase n=1 Tax=Setaria digitata TaxID=48799 RepID=A0A915PM47_9BILA
MERYALRVPFIYESLLTFRNSIFVFALNDTSDNDTRPQSIVLKGSITLLSNGHFIYMGTLDVSKITDHNQRKLYINDIQLYDAARKVIMSGVYKVETIGDAYMAACAVPTQCTDHAKLS